MSEEICKELDTLLKKSKPDSFMGLDGNDLEAIRQKSKKLSFDERASLPINFVSAAGTILYDAGGLFQAQIKIDDKQSTESKNRPLAYIKFTDGYKARVEVIDILESVRSDATLIGHPVILFAIHHWQEVLVWEKYNKQDDVYSKDKNIKALNYRLVNKFTESARSNLEAVGKALLEGTRRNAVQKETALSMKIQDLDIDAKNTYLRVAWERLSNKHINSTEEIEERIQKIKNYLSELPSESNFEDFDNFPPDKQRHEIIDTQITIPNVIDFLESDGSKFVIHSQKTSSQRPRWSVFVNAYIKWYFDKKSSTVEQYKKIAKTQKIEGNPYQKGIFNNMPETNVFGLLFKVLNKPLKNFCPPIECSEETTISDDFTDLIIKQ